MDTPGLIHGDRQSWRARPPQGTVLFPSRARVEVGAQSPASRRRSEPRLPRSLGFVTHPRFTPFPTHVQRCGFWDYSKEQKAAAEERKPPAQGLALPPFIDKSKKKKGKKKKPGWERFPYPLPCCPCVEPLLHLLKCLSSALCISLSHIYERVDARSKSGSEISPGPGLLLFHSCIYTGTIKRYQESARLVESNCQLVEEIQGTDDSTARQGKLLQQYEAFQRMKVMVQTFNQNQLETAKAELQEMEKTMEKNLDLPCGEDLPGSGSGGREQEQSPPWQLFAPSPLGRTCSKWSGPGGHSCFPQDFLFSSQPELQQQLEDVTAKVPALQEELRIVRPCTDGHYPEEAVKIILLQHSIRKLKRQQEEEIEKAEEMGKHILEQVEKKAQAEQGALSQKIVGLCGVRVTSQHRDQFRGGGRHGRGCHTLPISAQRVPEHWRSPPAQGGLNDNLKPHLLKERHTWHSIATQQGLVLVVTGEFLQLVRFSSPIQEMTLNQDGPRHMMISNNILRRDIVRQREVIQDLEEEIEELKRSIQTLRQKARDPRELIFADVLLRRPNKAGCGCQNPFLWLGLQSLWPWVLITQPHRSHRQHG
ncbi:uncharacterized protein C20orf96 homolog [Guaruba guarouba]